MKKATEPKESRVDRAIAIIQEGIDFRQGEVDRMEIEITFYKDEIVERKRLLDVLRGDGNQ